jgi:hypothetical protein
VFPAKPFVSRETHIFDVEELCLPGKPCISSILRSWYQPAIISAEFPIHSYTPLPRCTMRSPDSNSGIERCSTAPSGLVHTACWLSPDWVRASRHAASTSGVASGKDPAGTNVGSGKPSRRIRAMLLASRETGKGSGPRASRIRPLGVLGDRHESLKPPVLRVRRDCWAEKASEEHWRPAAKPKAPWRAARHYAAE